MARFGRTILGAVALIVASSAVTTQVLSQQDKKQAPAPPDMEVWMKLAQPGPEHAQLVKSAGTWEQKSSHWMYPGAQPETSTSTAQMEAILGGRFIVEKVRGSMNMGGQPFEFEGFGIFGFDNYSKKHVFAWADNMGTMLMTAEGTADPTGKVVTYLSTMPDPSTGATMEVKSVSRHVNDDKQVFEMHMKQPDGTWFKNFEIVSTRKK
jgi:hypothetical protein